MAALQTVLIALVPILAWGCWLLPASLARSRDERLIILGATLGNLAVAAAMVLGSHQQQVALSFGLWLALALGGALWTLGGVCALFATARLGGARAMGIWAPCNILVALAWGAVLSGESNPPSVRQLGVTVLAIALMLGGVRVLVGAQGLNGVRGGAGTLSPGLWAATGAGCLWGSYFLPARLSTVSPWVSAWPMSCGMLATSATVVACSGALWRELGWREWTLFGASGSLWAAGNYGSLILMERIGTGRGFALTQLCLVVNALAGIYVLARPPRGTTAAARVLSGCGLATAGGIALGLAA